MVFMSQLMPTRVAAAFRVLENFQRYRYMMSGAAKYNDSSVPEPIDTEIALPSGDHYAMERDAIKIVRAYMEGADMGEDPIHIILNNMREEVIDDEDESEPVAVTEGGD